MPNTTSGHSNDPERSTRRTRDTTNKSDLTSQGDTSHVEMGDRTARFNQQRFGRTRPHNRRTRLLWQFAALALLAFTFTATGYSPTSAQAADKPIKIVAFGDSLTAGYLLAPGLAFPAKLQKALRARGHSIDIRNAGVSGDTTTAGLARFDWAIGPDTEGVILQLGANDALRGQPVAQARKNLDAMMQKLRTRQLPVLLAGMHAPRGLGNDYTTAFDAIYPELAKTYGALLYPFFLEGVALQPKFTLSDGLHPNGAGVDELVKRILPHVERLIERIKAKRSAS
ncbi:MAG: arylesterase [Pseudomonadota bacterium]